MAGIIEKELSFLTIKVQVIAMGRDYQLLVSGGKAHIGCTVLAVPRPSLTGDGRISSTSSVLNVTGHKDEFVCRRLAEALCVQKNAVVVCSGGVHLDDISQEQIQEILQAVETIKQELCTSDDNFTGTGSSCKEGYGK